MSVKPNPPKNQAPPTQDSPKPILSQAQKYKKAWDILFEKLPLWKKQVILRNENKDNRVWDEFAHGVIILADSEDFG